MRKTLLGILLILSIENITNAQIKVVGDDYNSTLSGTKNTYSFDVDFEKYFSHRDARDYYGWLEKYMSTDFDMMGDTIWIPFTLKISDGRLCYGDGERHPDHSVPQVHWIIGGNGFAVATNEKGEEHWELFPPAGYYEVSGYVFCSDNASMLLNKYVTDVDNVYLDGKYSIGRLKDDILRDRVRIKDYLYYVKLSSINNINGYHYDYYVTPNAKKLTFFNLSYYNALRNHFLGKKVCLRNSVSIGKIEDRYGEIEKGYLHLDVTQKNNLIKLDDSKTDGIIILDALTYENVKLKDSIYIVKDIVVKIRDSRNQILKKGRDVAVCCILEGPTTGRFAIEMEKIQYNYTLDGSDGDANVYYDSMYYDYPYVTWGNWFKDNGSRNYYYNQAYAMICVDDLQQILSDVSDTLSAKKSKEIAKKRNEENSRKQRELDYQRKKEAEVAAFKQRINDRYGTSMATLILNHQISLGMTKEMVKDSWGRPMNTYRTTTKFGQSEVWCYNYKTRVYFYNGKVVQIDD